MIVLGTRKSALARAQTTRVARMLIAREEEVREVLIETEGDLRLDRPLRELEGKGFFTKELDRALLDGSIDAAVHSLKDLPTDLPDGLALAAVLERDDPHDSLLLRPHIVEQQPSAKPPVLRAAAVIGTSSLRRQAQLQQLFPHSEQKEIRGNVPTRIAKLCSGDYDGIVLARAGLDRLELELQDLIVHDFDAESFVPAPGQGAIAVVCRADDEATLRHLAPLDHSPTRGATTAERALLARFEGGCHLPLGALASTHAGRLDLVAFLERDGRCHRVRATGRDPETVARIAEAELRAHLFPGATTSSEEEESER